MFLRKGLSIIPTWGHKQETLSMYSSLCSNCEFISSYEYKNIKLANDSYVITYIPEHNADVVFEFEKKILQGLSTTKIIEIDEDLKGMQDFMISIKYINE